MWQRKGGAVFNLGLVGLANQGKEHLNAMPRCTRARFVAVCDSNEALRAEVTAAHPSLRAYATVEELVADPEVRGIVLALPHHVYPTCWGVLASSGKHLLKEKPLGRTLDEARLFVEEMARGGALFLTAIQRREHPSYVRLRELLSELRQQGARVHGLEASLFLGFPPGRGAQGWRGAFDSAGGGVLLDAGYHLVDLAHFLLGSLDLLAASLWCGVEPARPEDLEDAAVIHARGGDAWVRLAFGVGGVKQERVVLDTSLGMLEADREGVWRDGHEVFRCARDWQQAMADQLDHFADAVQRGERNEPVVWDQLPAMAFIERAYGLARLNMPGGSP
jgi:predicted dehydrogenase